MEWNAAIKVMTRTEKKRMRLASIERVDKKTSSGSGNKIYVSLARRFSCKQAVRNQRISEASSDF